MASFIKEYDEIYWFQYYESLYNWAEDQQSTVNMYFTFNCDIDDVQDLIYTVHAHVHYWLTYTKSPLKKKIKDKLKEEGFYSDYFPSEVISLYANELSLTIEGNVISHDEKTLILTLSNHTILNIDLINDMTEVKDNIVGSGMEEVYKEGELFTYSYYGTYYFMKDSEKTALIEHYTKHLNTLNRIYKEVGYKKQVETN